MFWIVYNAFKHFHVHKLQTVQNSKIQFKIYKTVQNSRHGSNYIKRFKNLWNGSKLYKTGQNSKHGSKLLKRLQNLTKPFKILMKRFKFLKTSHLKHFFALKIWTDMKLQRLTTNRFPILTFSTKNSKIPFYEDQWPPGVVPLIL